MSKQVKWDNLFSYDTLVHAVAGATGSITAMTVFFPLDTVRSRLQMEECRASKNTLTVMEELVREEGVQSLYRGLVPVLSSLCCSNFVYFYTFHGLRSVFARDAKTHNALQDLAIGSVAGIINVMMTTPLWVVNTRLKMQGAKLSAEDKEKLKKYPHYDGIIDAVQKIVGTEGWQTLWSGCVPSLMLVSNPAVQFMVYEALKRRAANIFLSKNLNAGIYFLIGAISKSISTVLTYPLQLIQSKLRYGSDNLKRMSVLEMMVFILRQQGAKGLFKGLEAKVLQTVFTAALMFLFYEKIVAFVLRIMKSKSH